MAEQNSKPSIRCPSCGESVALPAEACPKCSYNFRQGTRPQAAAPTPGSAAAASMSVSQEEEGRGRLYYIIGIAAAAIFVIILFIALSGSDKEPPSAGEPSSGTVLQAAPKLSESPLLHPERPIGAARTAAGAADQRADEMENIFDVNGENQK